MVKVKICGITNLEDARFSLGSGADMLGFIFWRGSPRCISPDKAKKIINSIGKPFFKVGVFVDEDYKKVEEIINSLKLNAIQLHGRESAKYCRYFKDKIITIKVFFPPDFNDYPAYPLDYFLFDVAWSKKTKGKKSIEQKYLLDIARIKDKKIIVSGGLNPDNVSYFIKTVNPYAVDVASGVEDSPGKKDLKKVDRFISSCRNL
jgi:phosphoribosylanthranilate isomerase